MLPEERILQLLEGLQVGMDSLRTEMNARFEGVENRLERVENRLTNVEDRLERVENRLTNVEDRLERVENRQEEQHAYLDALKEGQRVICARLEGLALNTASVESVRRVENKLEVMNARLFAQEAEIQGLKCAP